MAVLLLRLCGPMQSWGTQSRFTNRDTDLEPSKSGVIGLLCAALGKPREERLRPDLPSLEKLASLKMGVRVDREGKVEKDYHTAGGHHLLQDREYGVLTASGEGRKTVVSERFYLADACFLVALLGDAALLLQLDSSLKDPVWQLCLGRKCFVPGAPLRLPGGFLPEVVDLELSLSRYPYLCHEVSAEESRPWLRLELEADYGAGDRVKHDQPISFEDGHRKFALRHVRSGRVERAGLPSPEKEASCICLV